MDQPGRLTVQLLMFSTDDDAKEAFLDTICASVTQHFTSETGWSATSVVTKPEPEDSDRGTRGSYVFTLSHRTLPYSFDVANRQETVSAISTLCNTICDPKSSLSLSKITGGANVMFIPRHPPLSLHDDDFTRYFIISSLSNSPNNQIKFEDAPSDWSRALKTVGVWCIPLIKACKLALEVCVAMKPSTGGGHVQNAEALSQLGKAVDVLSPFVHARVQTWADNITSENDSIDRCFSKSRGKLIAAMAQVNLSVGYTNDNYASTSVKATEESLRNIQTALLQAEDTLMLANKDVSHKRGTSRLTKCLTSLALVGTNALFLASSSSGMLLSNPMLGLAFTGLGVGASGFTHVSSNDASKHTMYKYREIWVILAVGVMRNTSRDAEDNARLSELVKRIGVDINETAGMQKWDFDSINEVALRKLKAIDLASKSIKTGKQSVSAD